MDALEECHKQLVKLLGSDAEPIEVLRCAEQHRAYWRPEKVRVLLLAESHVYTAASELDCEVDLRRADLRGLTSTEVPRGFVRLVYCLGYGENKLLNRPINDPRNSGTPHFWKIFHSCVNRVQTNNDFEPILITRTAFPIRIQNKFALLQRLREAGVWLVDTSLAALYRPGHPKPDAKRMEECLRTSWDAYVGQVVRAANPSHIICIGKGVERSLGARLSGLGIPVTPVPQPNARLLSTEHLKVFQQYDDIVQRVSGPPRSTLTSNSLL